MGMMSVRQTCSFLAVVLVSCIFLLSNLVMYHNRNLWQNENNLTVSSNFQNNILAVHSGCMCKVVESGILNGCVLCIPFTLSEKMCNTLVIPRKTEAFSPV